MIFLPYLCSAKRQNLKHLTKMRMETKFYQCNTCGNLIVKVIDGGPVPVCCGEEMEELRPNTSEGKNEYHLPVVVKCDDKKLKIKVGQEPHPMTEAHHICFIYIETEHGGQCIHLKEGQPAEVSLGLCEKPTAIYAYCNLHGLWKVCPTCEKSECHK